MPRTRRSSVVVVPGDEPGIHVAYVPVLVVVTQGTRLGHALAMAREASELVAGDSIARGEELMIEGTGTVFASVAVDIPE